MLHFAHAGLTKSELVEAFTHLAFSTGWPNAVTAITQLRKVLEGVDAGQYLS